MDTVALRWFQEVADGATVTEVAETWMVSQPKVSRALAAIADDVGAPLLTRAGRVLRMTHAGAVFKRHVDRFINELDDGLAAVDQLVDAHRGTVTLAYDLSLGTWLVPSIIAGFHAVYPEVRFVLRQIGQEGLVGAPEGGLDDTRIDLEITATRPHGIPVQWQRLYREPLFLAVPSRHPWAQRGEIALREAVGEGFVVLRAPSPLRQVSLEVCRAAGFEPQVAFEVDDLPTVRGFVMAGLGVAIVPAMGNDPVPTQSGEARLVRLSDAGAYREVGLVWSDERRLLPSAELFRSHIVKDASDERSRHRQ
ncbi:MAG: LysR family transcriptional regulator [Dermatophilaceae bacterium]|nr:LysR family transcriptional regulator [Actinomycetales bacterium]MBP8880610.1 LysR family transcriptional regulator [Dermatophilaceae bacterium]MBP9918560.1 LysR family transcriptional regulator [Dermatophilaceae bacterium]